MTTKPSTVLDLDALEQEGLAPPFTFTMGGQEFTATNPLLWPWEQYDAIDASDFDEVMKAYLGEEQHAAFRAKLSGVPRWKIDRLSTALREHFAPTASE